MKRTDWEDPELTSSCGHTRATTTHGTTPSENHLKTGSTALLPPRM